jgi:hypothetical protein
MRPLIVTVFSIACSLAFPQKSQSQSSFVDRYENDLVAIVSRSASNLAILFFPPVDGNRVVLATNFPASQDIRFGFASTANAGSFVCKLLPEFAFRISAVSTSGECVRLTRKGSKYGRHFGEINGFDKRMIETSRRGPYWTLVAPQDSVPESSNRFPPPDELFDFERPGKYTVTIQAACLASPRIFPLRTTNFCLVKFPPVKLQITK